MSDPAEYVCIYVVCIYMHVYVGTHWAGSHEISKPQEISNRFRVVRLLWNLDHSAAKNCQISERYDHFHIKSRGFEILWDLVARHLTAYWILSGSRIKRSHEVSKPGPLFTKRTDVLPQDLITSRSPDIRSNRFKIWQAPWQQRCRDACQISL